MYNRREAGGLCQAHPKKVNEHFRENPALGRKGTCAALNDSRSDQQRKPERDSILAGENSLEGGGRVDERAVCSEKKKSSGLP